MSVSVTPRRFYVGYKHSARWKARKRQRSAANLLHAFYACFYSTLSFSFPQPALQWLFSEEKLDQFRFFFMVALPRLWVESKGHTMQNPLESKASQRSTLIFVPPFSIQSTSRCKIVQGFQMLEPWICLVVMARKRFQKGTKAPFGDEGIMFDKTNASSDDKESNRLAVRAEMIRDLRSRWRFSSRELSWGAPWFCFQTQATFKDPIMKGFRGRITQTVVLASVPSNFFFGSNPWFLDSSEHLAFQLVGGEKIIATPLNELCLPRWKIVRKCLFLFPKPAPLRKWITINVPDSQVFLIPDRD